MADNSSGPLPSLSEIAEILHGLSNITGCVGEVRFGGDPRSVEGMEVLFRMFLNQLSGHLGIIAEQVGAHSLPRAPRARAFRAIYPCAPRTRVLCIVGRMAPVPEEDHEPPSPSEGPEPPRTQSAPPSVDSTEASDEPSTPVRCHSDPSVPGAPRRGRAIRRHDPRRTARTWGVPPEFSLSE